MAGSEGIVFAFVSSQKATYAILGAKTFEGVPASGKNFMGISLMPYIKDYLVGWGIIHIMPSYNEFHCPETRGHMSGIYRTAFYYIVSQLLAELFQLP